MRRYRSPCRAASVAPRTVIETIASSNRYGFMVLERDPDKDDLWRIEAGCVRSGHDRLHPSQWQDPLRDGDAAVKATIGIGICIAALAGAALAQPSPEITRFSTTQAGAMPAGWKHVPLSQSKNVTEYSTVVDEGAVVLKASAHASASLMAFRTDFDPRAFPTLSWRWKVIQGIPGAEKHSRLREDAPARVMVSFAGDTSKLSVLDRAPRRSPSRPPASHCRMPRSCTSGAARSPSIRSRPAR
jgi:hypothetical protein